MNPTCPLLITLLPLLTLLLLFEKSISIDPNYVACKPFECGSLSIRYPFYFPPRQPVLCGSEGFKVSCNNKNQTIINLDGEDYIVNNISYQDLTINITNYAFSSSHHGCPSSIHNLTLDGDNRFNFTYNHRDLILLQNCSRNITSSSKSYTKIECEDNEQYHTVMGVYEEDFHPRDVGKCEKAVVVPYEHEDGSVVGIEGILRKGIVLQYTANNCTKCQRSGGRCGFTPSKDFFCFCPDSPRRGSCHPYRNRRLQLVLGTVFPLVGILSFIVLWFCLRRKKSAEFSIFRKRNTRASQNVEAFLKCYGSLAPKRYTYYDIKKMTSFFKEKVGEGGYGAVYKGKLVDGCLVAVKVLKQSKGDGEEFINEVASISRTNHVNIVTLLGFCFEGNKRALVYQYMVNGSLEKFTKGGANYGQSLTWEKLFQISLGIARGLEYLHRGCQTRILHFDIKPHNILLDENFQPKISDFGLAKLYPQDKQSKISMSAARGTIGYIAPEVFCRNFGDISHKSDVYSYGMMVLEVIGSRRRTNAEVETSSSDFYFPHWIYKQLDHGEEEIVDGLTNDNEKELKRKMIIVSLWCIQTIPSSRPSMSRVVQMLEASLETIEIPPMPSLASPPRSPPDLSGSFTMTL